MPCMQEIKDRSVFIHVDVPGHEDNAETLSEKYVILYDNISSILCSMNRKYFSNGNTFLTSWKICLGSYQFPSLQVLGEDLVTILDTLHVRYVIGLGEGAGANVIARFGLAHPTRTVGLILINCTGSAVSVKENFKAKVR